MKRRALITTAVVLFGLAACDTDTVTSAADDPAPASTDTTAPPVETTAPPTEPPPTEPPSTEPAAPDYQPFAEVDPYLSEYFIILERTTLAATQGEERLYNLGLGVCRNLDGGNTIDDEIRGLVDDARLTPDDAGSLIGAAVTDMCPHHGGLVEDYLAANG